MNHIVYTNCNYCNNVLTSSWRGVEYTKHCSRCGNYSRVTLKEVEGQLRIRENHAKAMNHAPTRA